MAAGSKGKALGLIETKGYGPAIAAADAALKAADVKVAYLESTIGSGASVGVTVYIAGEVAAVEAAVGAGKTEIQEPGQDFLVSSHVIPNLDEQVRCNLMKHIHF